MRLTLPAARRGGPRRAAGRGGARGLALLGSRCPRCDAQCAGHRQPVPLASRRAAPPRFASRAYSAVRPPAALAALAALAAGMCVGGVPCNWQMTGCALGALLLWQPWLDGEGRRRRGLIVL